MHNPRLSVSLPYWQDRDPLDALLVAEAADKLGFDRLWIGEMATFDAFALATAIGQAPGRIPLCIGPLAVAVRSPMTIAMGVASVAALTGRPVDIALGTSSTVVVRDWHGRERQRTAVHLEESARIVRRLLDGEKAEFDGTVERIRGYRLRLPGLGAAKAGPRCLRLLQMLNSIWTQRIPSRVSCRPPSPRAQGIRWFLYRPSPKRRFRAMNWSWRLSGNGHWPPPHVRPIEWC